MQKRAYLISVILVMAVIFYLSVIPVVGGGGVVGFDKVKHFFAYFLLALLTYKSTKKAWLAFFLAGTYGFLMEVLQFTLPFRSFSFLDIAVNYLGSFLLIFLLWCRVKTFI